MTQADGAGYGRESHLGPCAAAWLLKRCPLRSLTQAKPLLSARRELSGSHGSGGHRGRAGQGQPSRATSDLPRAQPRLRASRAKTVGTKNGEDLLARDRGRGQRGRRRLPNEPGALPARPPRWRAPGREPRAAPRCVTRECQQLGLRGQALRRAVDVLTDRHCTVRVDKERREATGSTAWLEMWSRRAL